MVVNLVNLKFYLKLIRYPLFPGLTTGFIHCIFDSPTGCWKFAWASEGGGEMKVDCNCSWTGHLQTRMGLH